MKINGFIRNNAYYDSVSLMQISKAVEEQDGVERAMVCMGTEMNKELLKAAGLLTEEFNAAKPSDLIISFMINDDADNDNIAKIIDNKLNEKVKDDKQEDAPPTSIASACKRYPELNLVVISLPGNYAAQEVRKSLNKGLNVMLFSDNVSLEDEISLKKLAHEKGLLMMGPDCGTAIINDIGLCFANSIRKGNIGVVGASGTGTQEVTVLIDHFGGGVTQVIGTGGRDLTLEVGGIMMLDSIEALDKDEKTEVLVLISKPPVEEVAERILAAAKKSTKPVVICFINSDERENVDNLHFVSTLEEAAEVAVKLATGKEPGVLKDGYDVNELKEEFLGKKNETQKYVRGLYCGGTICDETAYIFDKVYPDSVYSNVGKVNRLEKGSKSIGNAFIDLGDDEYTVGRPHPMIEPSLRNSRIIKEALDPETAIILFDVELGYGSHRNPAKEAIEAIKESKLKLAKENREVLFVAYVLGTKTDLQGYGEQVRLLQDEGVIVAKSNARAARLCLELIGGIR
ncbi:MAG: acyl-CoA synthetase FdrA [Clostridiaceae bacterium]